MGLESSPLYTCIDGIDRVTGITGYSIVFNEVRTLEGMIQGRVAAGIMVLQALTAPPRDYYFYRY